MSENEYNLRQFRLMLNSITDYESNHSSLGMLVSNLDALQSALEDHPLFRESFEPLWGQLEVTYAMMLDEERTSLNEIDEEVVNEAVSKMKALIGSQIV